MKDIKITLEKGGKKVSGKYNSIEIRLDDFYNFISELEVKLENKINNTN